MRFPVIMFLLSCIFYIVKTNGQEITDTVNIREIRVIAEGRIEDSGVKVTRTDSMARANTLTTDMSELISAHSPVFIKSYGRGSPAAASFRGTSSTHTQVLWNGMNLNSPMRGMADLSLLPVFFTDDVYLLNGSSSMINGSGALGGSINMVNNPDWSSGPKITALIEKGSFDTGKGFFKVNFGRGRISLSTRAFHESSQNNFTFYNSGVIPHSKDTLDNAGYSRTGVLQEVYLRAPADNIITARFWYQDSRRNLPQLMSYQGSDREEFLNDEQYRGQVEWKKYNETLNIQFFTGFNSGSLDYYRATPEFNFINEDSESSEASFFNYFKISRTTEKNYLFSAVFTANYHKVEASDRIRGNGYQQDRFEGGAMINMQLKPSGRLRGFALVRSEFYDHNIIYLIPAAGLQWQVSRNLPVMLLVNAGRNYNKPSLNDLYWFPGGNPGLLPEDGYSGDITLSGDFKMGKVSLKNEITSYISKIDNWIIWQPAANGAYYQEAGNVKNVFSRGIEYQVSGTYNWKGVNFRSGGNYAYTRTANVDAVSSADRSRGKQLVYIPKHKGNCFFSAGWKKFTMRYDMTYTGRRYTKSSNQESEFEMVLNPYVLSRLTIDKQAGWNKFMLNFKFSAENLFNVNYQNILWRPMPGRFYSVSIGLKYN